MKRFSNEIIQKERKKIIFIIKFGIVMFVIGVIGLIISLNDKIFTNYFVENIYSEIEMLYGEFIVFIVIGISMAVIQYFIYKRNYEPIFKDLTDIEVKILDAEMNSSDAKYYKKIQMYMTRNYVIDMLDRFRFYKYEDMVNMEVLDSAKNNIDMHKKMINGFVKDGSNFFVSGKVISIFMKDGSNIFLFRRPTNYNESYKMFNEICDILLSKNVYWKNNSDM